jgi:DNA-binding NarL/FixJ family response regulator
VKKYVSALLLKFAVSSRLELVVKAMERGFRP